VYGCAGVGVLALKKFMWTWMTERPVGWRTLKSEQCIIVFDISLKKIITSISEDGLFNRTAKMRIFLLYYYLFSAHFKTLQAVTHSYLGSVILLRHVDGEYWSKHWLASDWHSVGLFYACIFHMHMSRILSRVILLCGLCCFYSHLTRHLISTVCTRVRAFQPQLAANFGSAGWNGRRLHIHT